MIDWSKGLTSEQKEILEKILKKESKIPIMEHTFVSPNEEKIVVGRLLGKNSLIQEREGGYMYYIETNKGLEWLSAFTWSLKESKQMKTTLNERRREEC